MKDQVFMSKHTGELCVCTPLVRSHQSEHFYHAIEMDNRYYSIALTEDKPLAWILDSGRAVNIVSPFFVKKMLILLGDL